MLIHKSQYRALMTRLNTLDGQCAALEKGAADMQSIYMTLFSSFFMNLSEVEASCSQLDARLQPLEEQEEPLQEDQQAERRFIRGANNILNYGVNYGRDETLKADR